MSRRNRVSGYVALLVFVAACNSHKNTRDPLTSTSVSESKIAAPDVNPDVENAVAVPTETWLGTRAGDLKVVRFQDLDLRIRWCSAGSFLMGSPKSETGRHPDEDQVQVTLSNGFWMSETEVTKELWGIVMGHDKDRYLLQGPKHPMNNVSYDEVTKFCRELSTVAHQAGDLHGDWEFRLPTEAQWEYACRAGTTTVTAFGDSLSSEQANIDGKHPIGNAPKRPSLGKLAEVGSYQPNKWGLRDMHGNVWEWCNDWYTEKLPGGRDPLVDDVAHASRKVGSGKPKRLVRGGGYLWGASAWRTADRGMTNPDSTLSALGFRFLCCSVRR